jgi:hypothetical protein
MFGAAAHRLPLPGFSTGTGALVVSNVQTDGSRTLWLTLPGSRTVELMGDFTDWRPIAMTLAPDGRWYARMVLGPGAHRVNVRVDGDTWHAPPGLPVVPDDFGGVVGVLVIR